jgi:leukotriene-A4 hydrolase
VRLSFLVFAGTLFLVSCGKTVNKSAENKYHDTRDVHSYANPEDVRVRHLVLDLTVAFPTRTLKGSATLAIERQRGGRSDAPLILDSRDLRISSVQVSTDGVNFQPGTWKPGATDPLLGTPLTIPLASGATHVRIDYETSPEASALQWLTPEQTAGRKAPFLYTQGQSIHTRSWIPLQDTPGVRLTYSARVRVPKDMTAVMSARTDRASKGTGEFQFTMPQTIPSYLIALAVGDLEYRSLSKRAGVYAEPSVADKAAREFDDLEKIILAAEDLFGFYQWEQYDVLVLPPSFPYGGMENPRLTFVSPTLLAGDKSLVAVISHELAHSWSGNLVTNATWRDFWLNEGFTTYLEKRIQEDVYGPERAQMEQELPNIPDADEALYQNLKGRNPDDIPAPIAYTKGSLLLRTLHNVWGRDRIDTFFKTYFGNFGFKSITTGQFVDYIRSTLFQEDSALAAKVNLDEWLSGSGIPASAQVPKSEALDRAAAAARDWVAGKTPTASLPGREWSVLEWLRFLLALPPNLEKSKMAELDKAFGMSSKTNAEIEFQWLVQSIRTKYDPAYPALERFLTQVGRTKFVRPLYQELAKTPEGKQRAAAIYAKARATYHPLTQSAVEAVLK